MARREIEQPTVDEYGAERHPGWAMIGVGRSQGTGSALFDSDVKHSHKIHITVSRASRQRHLNRDWIQPREEIVEIEMTEAQWASFVSSMNTSPVPATLTFDRSQENPIVPGVPFEPRLAESLKEVRDSAKKAVEEVTAAFDAYQEKKNAANLRALKFAIANLPANMEFAATSLSGHAENVVQRAKADIEAHAMAEAQRLGIAAGEFGTLQLGAGEDES